MQGFTVQVLAITCGLSDGADLAWWQPWRTAATQRPWLPWAIAVQVAPLTRGAPTTCSYGYITFMLGWTSLQEGNCSGHVFGYYAVH